jgi:probable rRNA maturation factor
VSAAAGRLELAVQYRTPRRRLPARSSIASWVRAALAGRHACLTVRFVGAAEGRRLNSGFRRRHRATNVLAFAYAADDRGLALHLRGYDHERRRARLRMEAEERRILAGLGFPDPYGG